MSTSTFVPRFLSLSSVVRSRNFRACRATLLLPAAFLVALAMPAAQAQTATFNGYQTTLPATGLSNPDGVAVNAGGDVFISDFANNQVVELTPGGTQTTVTISSSLLPGTPCNGGAASLLCQPTGLAVDGSGNLYIADTGNNRVVEVTPSGTDTVVTTNITGPSGLLQPSGVAVDANGNIYIADTGNSRVVEVPTGGAADILVGSGFTGPYGVAVASTSSGMNVYVADTGNSRIVEDAGVTTTFGGTQTVVTVPVFNPHDVAVNVVTTTGGTQATYIYVANTGSSNVEEVLPSGTVTTLGTGMSAPAGVTVDAAGDVYIANSGNKQAVEISQSVNFGPEPVGSSLVPLQTLNYTFTSGGTLASVLVTTRGLPSTQPGAEFFPVTVASNPCTAGQSYVAGDTCAIAVQFSPLYPGTRLGGVQLINSSGAAFATTYIWGTGTGPLGFFWPGTQSVVPIQSGFVLSCPKGLAVDGAGNLYIGNDGTTSTSCTAAAGAGAPSVLRITPGGTQTTVPVTGANLAQPYGLDVDGVGNLFITDDGGGATNAAGFVVEVPASVMNVGGSTYGTGTDAFPYAPGGTVHPDNAKVNGAGDLYVDEDDSAGSHNPFVNEYTLMLGGDWASPGTWVQRTVITNLCNPEGLAVDGVGDVYYTDNGASPEVVAEIPAGGVKTLIPSSGLSRAKGATIDAAGDIYIANTSGTQKLLMITPGGVETSIPIDTAALGGLPLNGPVQVVFDGNCTLYVADTGNNRVIKIDGCQQSLTFATTAQGSVSSDSPQLVTFLNIGNASLDYTGLSATTNFDLNGAGGTCLSTEPSWAPSSSCVLSVDFAPTVGGLTYPPPDGAVNISDNNLGATGTQQVQLNGDSTWSVPTITSINPSQGPPAGGTSVDVVGTNFDGTTSVMFGATPATSFTINSPTSITAIAPAGSGTQPVTVVTPGGTSNSEPYTYVVGPSITSLSPGSSPTWGGVLVTINGSNFGASPSVTFGSLAGTSVTVNGTGTQITVYAPAEPVGTVNVTVTVGGVASNTEPFNYFQALTVTSVNPSIGPAGTPNIIITGTGFIAAANSGCSNPTGATPEFGGVAATTFVVNSATQITATSPAGPTGTVDVQVSEPNCSGAISPTNSGDKYTYGTPTPTTTTLAASPNPTSYGSSVTLAATVASSGGGTPTGSVTFYDNGTAIGLPQPLTNGTATLTTTTLPVGSDTLTATYAASGNYAGSTSGPVTETITAIPTTTTLTASPSPAAYGSSVTLTATVMATGAGTPGGTVQFYNGGVAIGSPVGLNASGVATLTTTTLPAGTDNLTVKYPAQGNYAASSGATTENITPAATTTTLAANPTNTSVGNSVTLTATVTSNGNPVTSGTVTFSWSGGNCSGAVNASTGQAACNTTTLPVGTDTITASYGATANYGTSSGTTTVTITGPPATTTSITALPTSTSYGSSVTLTSQVLANGAGVTSGTVIFSDNGSPISGSIPVNSSGVATFSTTSLPMGTNNVSASYASNSSYTGSTSAITPVTITGAATSTSLNVYPPNSSYGQNVTLTATVTSNGSPVTSGTVNFYNNGTLIGTAPVNGNGVAVLNTTSLPAGSNTLTASYPTQGTYMGSPPSPSSTSTVTGLTTATTLVANPTSSGSGGNVTLTATVTSSGSPVANGTVTFDDNGTYIGNGVLVNGVASMSTNNLPVGTDNITATYGAPTSGAGSNYAPSTSPQAQVTITATPSGPYFTLTATTPPATVNVGAPGQSGSTTLILTPMNGYQGSVGLSCQNLPWAAACSFTQSGQVTGTCVTLGGSGAQSVLLTINTNVAEVQAMPRPFGSQQSPLSPILPALAFWWPGSMAGLAAFGRKKNLSKTRQRMLQLCLLVLMTGALAAGISGCAGGTYGMITPAGKTNTTVTAASCTGSPVAPTQTLGLTVNVQ